MFDSLPAQQSDLDAVANWEQVYRSNLKPSLWGSTAVPFMRHIARRYCRPDSQVLVLPCGEGRNTLPLLEYCDELVAADASPSALRIASARLGASQQRNWRTVLCEAGESGFAADQFDLTLCWDLLGHLRDPARVVSELLRVTRPGGLVIGSLISTECSTRGLDMDATDDGAFLYDGRYYFRFYDRAAAHALLVRSGAELLELDRVAWVDPPHDGYRPYPHLHVSWSFILRKPGRR
ncbi:class I SAM-dependent methyltransferase [Chitinimonas lacunae]|uniref:Class I SAM-dependent methyltransferase n=1 Tax=Chitinimonas lacunae TaxID=1963018 RepID=A0ABV8MTQ1_9NEIS